MIKLYIYSIYLFLLSLFFLILNFYYLLFNIIIIMEWNIFSLNSMKFNFMVYLDSKSMMFLFLVSLISSMILLYSVNYMNLENFLIKRFFYLMMLFLTSMYFLIISFNMLTIMIGWDGLGLISYCLIIYYQKNKSFNSGMLTIILNRLGDCSLLMLISMMMMFGSWNLMLYKINNLMTILFIMMIFTKSAQIPFCTWLPMAMMAPTPVSSLVHSSTLVTAGVYLMFRYLELLEMNYKNFILLISSLTMLYSGISANFELDIKKIIAYSTLSQLSFMMSILSLNLKDLAFLHLFIHAMFKSLMFMCVGSYIHYLNNNQNLKFYNGMFYIYPMKSLIFMFSLFSLMGFPFLVGFYSKDLMIENYFISKMNLFSNFNLIISTMLTIMYSFRIMMILLNKNLNLNLIYFKEDNLMNFCMLIMMIFSIFLSKIMFNLMFMLEIMILNFFMKMLIFKMFMLSFILNMILNKLMFKKNIMMFYYNFMNLNLIYKKSYLKSLQYIYLYEIMFEKIMMELITSKFMLLLNKINMYFNFKVYNIVNLYIFMFLLLIFLIKLLMNL